MASLLSSTVFSLLLVFGSHHALSQTETGSSLKISNVEAVKRAKVELAKQNHAEVIALLEKRKSELGPAALLMLAQSQRQQKRFVDAVTVLDLLLALDRKNVDAMVLRAQVLAQDGKVESAITQLTAAREKMPRNRKLGEAHLELLLASEARQEARDLIEDLTKQFGARPMYVSARCRLAALDAFYEEALEYCEKASQVDPKSHENIIWWSQAIAERKSKAKAFDLILREAKKRKKSFQLQIAVAESYREQKNFMQAFNWFTRAQSLNPKDFSAQIGVAETAFELQKLDVALSAYKKACAIDRKALTSLQGAAGRLRSRNDQKWISQFDDAIPNCQAVIPSF